DLQALALAAGGQQRTQPLRTGRNMNEIDDLGLGGPARPELAGDAGWQPLPAGGRRRFMASGAFVVGRPALIALEGGAVSVDPAGTTLLAEGVAAWLLLVAYGAWMGLRRYRYTRWLLDADGFALRRGCMWHSETRVPASRVQHLDIRRGPVERRLGLSTLLVHTAGTRQQDRKSTRLNSSHVTS